MKQVIGFMVFLVGVVILCASGRNMVLTWTETMFVLGAVITTGSGLYLMNERGNDERENNEREIA